MKKNNCRACHTINGRGGTIGPDLTFEGDKAVEQFNYARLGGRPSVFAWHVAHFQNPKMVSPDTVMPNFNLSSKEAQALALLVMSWRRGTVPAHYIPGVELRDVPTQAETEAEQRMLQGEGAFFVKKGCFMLPRGDVARDRFGGEDRPGSFRGRDRRAEPLWPAAGRFSDEPDRHDVGRAFNTDPADDRRAATGDSLLKLAYQRKPEHQQAAGSAALRSRRPA